MQLCICMPLEEEESLAQAGKLNETTRATTDNLDNKYIRIVRMQNKKICGSVYFAIHGHSIKRI